MQFFLLISTLVTATLPAADNSSRTGSSPKFSAGRPVYSLQTLIMKQYCEKIPPILVSRKSWGKELAVAFAIGLELGKQTNIAKRGVNRAGTTTLFVAVKELGEAILANTNWKWDAGAINYKPFNVLFDFECVLNRLQLWKLVLRYISI